MRSGGGDALRMDRGQIVGGGIGLLETPDRIFEEKAGLEGSENSRGTKRGTVCLLPRVILPTSVARSVLWLTK